MLLDGDVAAVLRTVITEYHPAVTIAQRVTIGAYVLDVRLLDATPAAAAWYGVDDPTVLRGCWQSQLYHPEDAWLATVFMEARRRGLPAPTRYVCRVRQVPSSDRYVPVTAETLQLTVGTDVYWFTILSEPTEPPLAGQSDVWQRFPLPQDLFASLTSRVSVAAMERTLRAGGIVPPPAMTPTTDATPRQLEMVLGETVQLADGIYAHRCARCTDIWVSRNPTPARCGKRRCQQPAWRDLPRRFQRMQQAGSAVTPVMIRAARRQRRARRTIPSRGDRSGT
jgi:hypothetical protein